MQCISALILLRRLHKTQDLLYDSTRDFLQLRYDGRAHERKWMGEKDRLLRELDRLHSEMQIHRPSRWLSGLICQEFVPQPALAHFSGVRRDSLQIPFEGSQEKACFKSN